VIACFVAASAAASAIPGLAEILEYDRAAVSRSQIWRAATGQLVHWGFAMTALDLTVVAIAGACLEWRSRRIVGWTLALAIAIVGITVALGLPSLDRYRGSSGIGSALVVALLIDVIRRERGAAKRAVAAGIGVLYVAKLAWELATGAALPFGHLPPGIALVPQAHLAGTIAGLAASALSWRVVRADF
jgi:rhomboid family GlyGly-CTERM serine protease